MTPDLLTPFAIAVRSRLRQVVIWTSSFSLVSVYFIASRLRSHDGGGVSLGHLESLDLSLLLGWSTASLGVRPAFSGSISSARPLNHHRDFDASLTLTSLRLGTAVADALVVAIGTCVIAITCGFMPVSAPEAALVLVAAGLIGAATSLQFDVTSLFVNRAVVLVVTALLTASAMSLVHSAPSVPVALLGRLGFPVSAVASATEEPLRLDLAARALLAGVTYDLALVATLLALPGNRARG
jgi:hypothetical protein